MGFRDLLGRFIEEVQGLRVQDCRVQDFRDEAPTFANPERSILNLNPKTPNTMMESLNPEPCKAVLPPGRKDAGKLESLLSGLPPGIFLTQSR